MDTHTTHPDADLDAHRAAVAARLGLVARPPRPAARPAQQPASPAAPPSQPAPAPSVLDALAATPAHRPAHATTVRVDGDGRVALRELADQLDWTADPAPVTVLADRASRRLWVVPTPAPCSCDSCACSDVRPPSDAFAASELTGTVQSKHRLKLPRGLWSALAVEPGGDLVLAVAVHGALLLASVHQLAAALVTDLATGPGATTRPAPPTTPNRNTTARHLEVVA